MHLDFSNNYKTRDIMEQNFNNPQHPMGQSSFDNRMNSIPPKNNLALAIFSTVCCCLPLGIYAIILSTKVNTYFATGQVELAYKYSADAKKWSIIAIILGIITNSIYAAVNFSHVMDRL